MEVPLKTMSPDYKIIRDCFLEINKFRKEHSAQPLNYEKELEKSAQKTAETLARLEKLQLGKYSNFHYGEITGKLIDVVNNITGAQIAATWYATGDQYLYILNEPCGESESFTQMVWASSESIGLGFQINEKGDAYFVGHFMPKGNIPGNFLCNVFPRQIRSQSLHQSIHEVNRIAVERVNYYRLRHRSPPLSIALDLITTAQNRATEFVRENKIVKTETSKCFVGENSFLVSSRTEPLRFEFVIDKWYQPGKECDYLFEHSNQQTDSFTQLVWKSSTHVGFGIAFYNGNFAFVAHFSPPGNVKQQFHKNVEKPVDPKGKFGMLYYKPFHLV